MLLRSPQKPRRERCCLQDTMLTNAWALEALVMAQGHAPAPPEDI